MKILIKLCFVCLLTLMANVDVKAQLYSVTTTPVLVGSSANQECYSVTVRTNEPVYSIKITGGGSPCYNTNVCTSTVCFDRVYNRTSTEYISCQTKLTPASSTRFDGCIVTISPY